MNTLQTNDADAERFIPDAARAKAKVALKVIDTSTLKMVASFDYKDDKCVSETGKLCIDFAHYYAKAPGVPKVVKIVATALMSTDQDPVLVKHLKLQWVECLVLKGFTQVKPASKADAMDVDASGILEYEKAI